MSDGKFLFMLVKVSIAAWWVLDVQAAIMFVAVLIAGRLWIAFSHRAGALDLIVRLDDPDLAQEREKWGLDPACNPPSDPGDDPACEGDAEPRLAERSTFADAEESERLGLPPCGLPCARCHFMIPLLAMEDERRRGLVELAGRSVPSVRRRLVDGLGCSPLWASLWANHALSGVYTGWKIKDERRDCRRCGARTPGPCFELCTHCEQRLTELVQIMSSET